MAKTDFYLSVGIGIIVMLVAALNLPGNYQPVSFEVNQVKVEPRGGKVETSGGGYYTNYDLGASLDMRERRGTWSCQKENRFIFKISPLRPNIEIKDCRPRLS